ncbi:MAG: YDG domain-containing protein, partial [Kiritimatiellota bacterium]|nr:YDG domain-containing protein [Kiritimatiellota bacterium]
MLTVPVDVSPTAYLLGANQSWLSVVDSEGAGSGTIATGTNKTIVVTLLPAGLAIGSYSGIVTSGVAWLDVTVNVDIVPGELGLDGLIVNNKKYDGNVWGTVFSYGTLRGVVGTEDVRLVTNNASAEFRHGAGPSSEAKLVYVSGMTLTGAQAGNYSINNIRTTAYIMFPSMAGDFDGDRLADPAMMATSGVWKIWLSSAGYAPVTAGPFYVAGSAVLAGDFDGDRLADPAVMTTNGILVIWLSSVSYLQVATGPFYVAGSTAVTADFDGDRFADPAAVAANGVWTIWMSSASYAPVTTIPFYVAGGAAVAADFDGDCYADPAMMATNGIWTIWMSSAGYAPVNTS